MRQEPGKRGLRRLSAPLHARLKRTVAASSSLGSPPHPTTPHTHPHIPTHIHLSCLVLRPPAALELIRQAGNVAMSLTMSAIVPVTILAFTARRAGRLQGLLPRNAPAGTFRTACLVHLLALPCNPPGCSYRPLHPLPCLAGPAALPAPCTPAGPAVCAGCRGATGGADALQRARVAARAVAELEAVGGQRRRWQGGPSAATQAVVGGGRGCFPAD